MLRSKFKNIVKSCKSITKLDVFRTCNKSKEKFICPICNYRGPFLDLKPLTGFRKYAKCPKCGLLERHRLQQLVFNQLSSSYDFSKMKILHFAPEAYFRIKFQKIFSDYTSADLFMKNVDFHADLKNLPFHDAEYDLVYASHVLEHIKEDLIAISEIRRVLRPNGIAILPVPILAEKTVEYSYQNPHESDHVRLPGFDYYNRYKKYFSRVEKYSSKDFSPIYQVFTYEKRDNWPTKEMPLRKAMKGEKHIDTVPVCFV